jgi:hypothetical protein
MTRLVLRFLGSKVSSASINYMTNTWVLRAIDASGMGCAHQPAIGHVIVESLLIHYLGNQRASIILIIQIALPFVSRIVPHTVPHTSRTRLECVS